MINSWCPEAIATKKAHLYSQKKTGSLRRSFLWDLKKIPNALTFGIFLQYVFIKYLKLFSP